MRQTHVMPTSAAIFSQSSDKLQYIIIGDCSEIIMHMSKLILPPRHMIRVRLTIQGSLTTAFFPTYFDITNG